MAAVALATGRVGGWRGLVVGQPVFVWLTPAGARLCGSPFKVWEPNTGVLAHVAAVNEVRLHVVTRRLEAEWISERAGPRPGGTIGASAGRGRGG